MATLNLQIVGSPNNGDAHMESITSNMGNAPVGVGVCSITAVALAPGSHGLHNDWSAACRFLPAIPQGSTITSADFIMTVNGSWDATPNVIKYYVSTEAADNSAALSVSSGDLSSSVRPRNTSQSVAWTQTTTTNNVENTVSITAGVQAVVSRAGFVSGNGLTVFVDTHPDCTVGEWQEYFSWDNTPAKAPKLQIVYTTGGSAPRMLSLLGVG